MLLWELLTVPVGGDARESSRSPAPTAQAVRLPYDRRCSAVTRSGRRCRGRIVREGEWCFCHDPDLMEKRRRRVTEGARRRYHRLTHLPDGYLRKLTSRRAVGEAMDRLYREVRLGVITPEMGRVMYTILNRVLDSGLADLKHAPKAPARSKAERIRPKLGDVLTRAERSAWRKAVANAPLDALRSAENPAQRAPRWTGTSGAPVRPETAPAPPSRMALPVAS